MGKSIVEKIFIWENSKLSRLICFRNLKLIFKYFDTNLESVIDFESFDLAMVN